LDRTELLKKVRLIEIKSKGLSDQVFSGEYHSAFNGRGMAFSEVREYSAGDDIRSIDWNVTARFGHPYIKIMEEERELTVMLMIDISGSEQFGTNVQTKRDLITELAAVLAFSALKNNDKIGAILFTDKIEKFIPPKKGKSHVLQIISAILAGEAVSTGTDISQALSYFTNVIKKRSICFVISDFFDFNFEDKLKLAKRKHDVVALNIHDIREFELPSVGLIRLKDAETGELRWINTWSKKERIHYKAMALKYQDRIKNTFSRSGVDFTTISTGQSYVQPLMNLFKKRETR
jgi:uncharacterized protein (DUF58 family)